MPCSSFYRALPSVVEMRQEWLNLTIIQRRFRGDGVDFSLIAHGIILAEIAVPVLIMLKYTLPETMARH